MLPKDPSILNMEIIIYNIFKFVWSSLDQSSICKNKSFTDWRILTLLIPFKL